MPNQDSFGGIKERIILHRLLGASLAGLAVFLLGFVLIPTLRAEASASQYADASVSWGAVSLTLDPDYGNGNIDDEGHGDINFGELVPTENNLADAGSSYGTMKVVKKTIGITSSGKYYTVYLSTSSNNNNLNLELSGGGTNSSINIPAVSSAFTTPAGFVDSSWGYAVPGVQTTGIPSAPSTFVVPQLLDTQIGAQTSLTGASQTYNDTKWAAVPALDEPQQIWKAEAQGTAGANYGFGIYTNDQSVEVTGDTVNNHFDIYYAVAVDTDVLAGTYSNHIIYTALANASSLDSVSNNINHDRTFGGTGDTVTIRFDLTQSTVTLSESDITVTLVPHDVMVDNNYDSVAFDITSLGSNTTPGYLDCPVVPDSITVDGYVEIECIMPSAVPADNSGNGAYDFWVHVAGYGYNYVSKDTITKGGATPTVPAFLYAGLQTDYPTSDARYDSTSDADNHIVKEMQQMSAGVCRNTNMWSNQMGNDARIYDYTGLKKLVADVQDTDSTADDYYDSSNYASAAAQNLAQNIALGIGSFKLIDNRDQKPYLVRHLADGNCWMVQNLGLDLEDFAFTHNLTDKNTDLNTAGKTYWDPAESMYTLASSIDPTVTRNNYFEVASLNRLGISQHYQFLPYGINDPDYSWGSLLKQGSSTEVLGSTGLGDDGYPLNKSQSGYFNTARQLSDGRWVENNRNAIIPRSVKPDGEYWYRNGGDNEWTFEHASLYYGIGYNLAAVDAESNLVGNKYIDSICSRGWMFPEHSNGDRGWMQVLSAYGNIWSGAYVIMSLSALTPISLAPYGLQGSYVIADHTAIVAQSYWANRNYATYRNIGVSIGSDMRIYSGADGHYGSNAQVLRCVNRADKNAPDPDTACAANKICYDANGGTGTAIADQASSANTSATLKTPTFTKEGATFIGWSTSADGYGTIYGPNETITTPSTLGSSGLRLYAKWVASSGTMQDFTTAQCAAMSTNDVIALTDSRDGNVYSVAKLADGKCWMTQESLIDFRTANITANNTHNPTQDFLDNYASTEITTGNTTCTDNTEECINHIVWKLADPEVPFSRFNWYTATAGNGVYATTTKATGDLCPFGWHIPSGGYSGEYKLLDNALGGTISSPAENTAYTRYPINFLRNSTSAKGWSSTPNGTDYAYLFDFNTAPNPATYPYSSKTLNVAGIHCIKDY